MQGDQGGGFKIKHIPSRFLLFTCSLRGPQPRHTAPFGGAAGGVPKKTPSKGQRPHQDRRQALTTRALEDARFLVGITRPGARARTGGQVVGVAAAAVARIIARRRRIPVNPVGRERQYVRAASLMVAGFDAFGTRLL